MPQEEVQDTAKKFALIYIVICNFITHILYNLNKGEIRKYEGKISGAKNSRTLKKIAKKKRIVWCGRKQGAVRNTREKADRGRKKRGSLKERKGGNRWRG